MSESVVTSTDGLEKASEFTSYENLEESLTSSMCVVTKPQVSTPVSILIESLVKNICSIYESDPQKASLMYTLICDKLFKMNLIDESYIMNEFEGMRCEYQRAFLHLLTSVKSGDKTLPLRPIWPKTDINSHYLREFEEVEYIAGGGFGKVYRVKHKLDGTEYAIKKIPIHSEGIESVKNYLSEVKTFASMNHSNIVQYKAAWLEIGAPSVNKTIKHSDSNNIKNKKTFATKMNIEHSNYIFNQEITESFTDRNDDISTDFEIDFEHSISGTTKPKSRPKSRQKKHSISEGDRSVLEGDKVVCKLDHKEIEKIRFHNRARVKWATLYIQMALCQTTLKHWLEKRNSVSEPAKAIVTVKEQALSTSIIREILIQILKGLGYIHSKGIVHHDIKPSNIFIQSENGTILIQLGDFGLACPLQSVRHSLAFGTKLYAAPEQLAGKCDRKSDVYSVGIVLFELVQNFRTDMERVQHITELRKGHVPSELLSSQPELAQIISRLIVKNPVERPDTTELLHLLRSSEAEQLEYLKMKLAEKEDEILHLKELLISHGIKSI